MAKLIVEVVNKQGRVVSRHFVNEPFVRVGRGYANGVVLSDPFISPEHIAISAEDDCWRVEDLNSRNGLFRKENDTPQKELLLNSGDEICIGKTYLRILSPDHSVPPAATIASPPHEKRGASAYLGIAITIFLALGMLFAKQYLDNAEEVGIEKLFAKTLLVMPLALLWAGGWALLGKVSKQKHCFNVQLQITMVCIISILVLSTSMEYVEYNVQNAMIVMYLKIISFGLLAGYSLSRHLLSATLMELKNVRKVAMTTVFSLIGVSGFVYYAITSDFDPNPSYSLTLKPPLAKIKPSVSIENFFKANKTLFQKLK